MKDELPRDSSTVDDSRFENSGISQCPISSRWRRVISRHREIYRKADSRNESYITSQIGLIIAMTNATDKRDDVCADRREDSAAAIRIVSQLARILVADNKK